MFTTESSVLIRAPAERVWEHVSDLERSWPPSNPEHVETRVLSEDKRLREGLRYFDRERVGGVEARMVASVHDVVETRRFRWSATAEYRVVGLHVPVEEGGTFQLEPVPEGTRVSHAIWARFPNTRIGRAAEWFAVHLLRSERAARRHNRVELEHFKRVLEAEPTRSPAKGMDAADLQVSAHVEVAAPPEVVWALLSDPERWWVASNPEDHESLEVLTDERPIPEGARLRIRERVAGIPCVAEGPIAERIEGRRVTWEATARYRLLGIEIAIHEGVAWEIGPRPEGSMLAAHVWARFPEDWRGRLVRRLFEGPLRGPERDRQHALRELVYLKEHIEAERCTAREASKPVVEPARGETP